MAKLDKEQNMETKNLKSIEWRYNKWEQCVRIRITTAETLRPRIFVVCNCASINGYNMEIYNDWAELESVCGYRSLITVFEHIAEVCDCEFAELVETMLNTDKLLSNE